MSPGDFIDQLSPQTRVAIALVPFLWAIMLRLFLGKNRLTRVALSLATMWFAINVLMAPYSMEMRRQIFNLSGRLR
jgi:hypothetical protein